MAENRISWEISEEKMSKVLAAIATIEEALADLTTLPNDEKITARMGAKSLDFTLKAEEYGGIYPEIMPGHVDLKEMNKDTAAYDKLTTIDRRLAVIIEKVQDNRALAGSEAFAQARDIYHSAARAAKAGIAGAKTAFEDLKRRYPGFRGDRSAAATPAT